jgi:hypothetical protein
MTELRDRMTLQHWHELQDEEQEYLRQWALRKGYGLEIVPSQNESFDPSCDYAALLTGAQLRLFLKEQSHESTNRESIEELLQSIKQTMQKKRLV